MVPTVFEIEIAIGSTSANGRPVVLHRMLDCDRQGDDSQDVCPVLMAAERLARSNPSHVLLPTNTAWARSFPITVIMLVPVSGKCEHRTLTSDGS